ncbi:plasmid recombination enzyme [Streptococcus acidominimus]|uniref:Plasmid recombination enzyme n=1 Tax=Streptococcus acidominimus TaxID=1326 RepID=A0A239XLU5_STRAI|nr:MobV family relaxase [Streptococcus acidominimus]SNV47647.1 plasmid recombination enzyme [Streptococcus acidominimus]
MSYMVARMQKMKAGNLGGAYKHNERVFETHSNKDIDPSRSHLNYELTGRDSSVTYERQIKDYVNENKISNRAIRKDAVLCDEWIITSDKSFFEKLIEEEKREFFETAKNYFAENYGEDNIAYASVHLDESTPHMHMGVVPFQDGKLSSKAMFDKEELKKIQEDLPKYMNEHGFDLERGELNSEAKHKTVAEFKQEMASKELEKQLVKEYGAPEYINETTGEFYDRIEYHNFTEFPREENLEQVARETTYQEKLGWVKWQQKEQLQTLELSKTPLKDEIRALNEVLREKYEELKKSSYEPLRAYQSYLKPKGI